MTERQTVSGAYSKIESHEEICAERYSNINTTLNDLKTGVKTARNTMMGVLFSLLAFLAQQVWSANNDRITALEKPGPAVVVQQKND